MRFLPLLRGVLLGCTLLAAVPAEAQLFDVRQVHVAYQLGLVRTEQSVVSSSVPGGSPVVRKRPFMMGAVGGYTAPLAVISDDQAIGLSLNAAVSFVYAPNFRLERADVTPIFISLPEYVTWRYGAGATTSSSATYGVGVGAGYRFGFVFAPGFHAPAAMAEFVFDNGHHKSFLRLSTDLATYSHESAAPVGVRTRLRAMDLMLGYRL